MHFIKVWAQTMLKEFCLGGFQHVQLWLIPWGEILPVLSSMIIKTSPDHADYE